MTILRLVLVLMLFSVSYSTIGQRNCGTVAPKGTDRDALRNEMAVARLQANKITATSYVPVTFHFLTKDDGADGENIGHINQMIAALNHQYINADMLFYIAEVKTVANTALYTTDFGTSDTGEQELAELTEVDNSLNVYVVDNVGDGTVGYAYFPFNAVQSTRSLVVINAEADTYIHEFGHFFGLYHTHDGTEEGPTSANAENVARTGVQANCDTNGDGLCDTDADPQDWDNFDFWNCEYTGNGMDQHGVVYTPPVSNIMSYYSGCTNQFTAGQFGMIADGLQTRLGHWRYTLDAPHTNVAAPVILSAEVIGNSIVIEFQDNATNETGYILERGDDQSGPFIAVSEAGVAPNETTIADQPNDLNGVYFYRVVPSNCMTCQSVAVQVGEEVVPPTKTPTLTLTTDGWECPMSVTITGADEDSDFEIHYTLNGDTPDTLSATAPSGHVLDLVEGQILKAIAVDTSGNYSTVKETKCRIPGPGVTVYFKSPDGNQQVPMIHYWNAVPNDTTTIWPGIAMDDVSVQYGDGWYVATVPEADTTCLLFHYNDGAGVDGFKSLDLCDVTEGCYDMNQEQWIACPTGPPATAYCTPIFRYWYADNYAMQEVGIGESPEFVNNSLGNADETQLSATEYEIYTDFRGTTDTIEIYVGVDVPVRATLSNLDYVGLWIDLNNDGTYAEAERLFSGTAIGDQITGQFTVDNSDELGLRSMRMLASDSPIGGACDTDYESGEAEDYYVIIQDPIITSLRASSSAGILHVWPQPAADYLNVVASFEVQEVSIFNGLGQELARNLVSGTEIKVALTGLSSGVYIVNLSGEQQSGQQVFVVE